MDEKCSKCEHEEKDHIQEQLTGVDTCLGNKLKCQCKKFIQKRSIMVNKKCKNCGHRLGFVTMDLPYKKTFKKYNHLLGIFSQNDCMKDNCNCSKPEPKRSEKNGNR